MSSGRILVIDDSEVMLERIKKALVAEGYEVTTTTRAIGNARYLPTSDLVIIDYHMPGISGETVIQALRGSSGRADESTSGSPRKPATCLFYLYTSDAAIAHRYSELGFDGSISEKGDEASLVRQVGSIFRMRKIRALADRGTSRRSLSTAPNARPGSSNKVDVSNKPDSSNTLSSSSKLRNKP